MNSVRIGNLKITKKGIIIICLFSFLYGTLLGIIIFWNYKKYHVSLNIIMIVFSSILWKQFKKQIKNEIITL